MKLLTRFLVLAGLAALALPTFAKSQMPAAVVRTSNSIRMTIDPRLELIAIAQYVSDFRDPDEPLIVKEDFAYRRDVDAYFGRFKNHPAVKTISEMSRSGCSYSFPSLSMLYLDEKLRSRRDLVPDSMLAKQCGGTAKLDTLTSQLRDFSKVSRFAVFFEQHREYYAEIEAELASTLDHDYISDLEKFYGVRYAEYRMYLVPLYGPVGYGPVLETTKGEKHICAVLGTHSIENGRPRFGNKSYLAYMQRHEFSHSFVNPLTTRFAAEVSQRSGLLSRMGVAQQKGVCGDWEECLNESIVRAVTTYFAFGESPEAGQKALEKEIGRGAALTPEILEGLREYSADRNKYPTLAAYYPALLARLAKLQQQPAALNSSSERY